MRRHLKLALMLCAIGLLAIILWPVAIQMVVEVPAQFRATQELARRERFREGHPPERPFALREPEVILRAGTARSVRVVRFEESFAGSTRREWLDGYPVLRDVPVDGEKWGRRFLIQVMRMATDSRPEQLRPRFGARFVGRGDTVDVLIGPPDGRGVAALFFTWKDSSGHVRHVAAAHLPYSFEGSVDADSTLKELRPLPPRL